MLGQCVLSVGLGLGAVKLVSERAEDDIFVDLVFFFNNRQQPTVLFRFVAIDAGGLGSLSGLCASKEY